MKNYSKDPSRQYHIQVAPGEVGRYVILPGDPGRCEEIAELFDDAHLVAYNREFKTYTGYLDGEMVSVCSTGIGGPSAAIAVEELYKCGADTFIRVGTCGGIQLDVKSGDVVIGQAAIRAEGTSKEIAPIEYPAVADFTVTTALVEAALHSGKKVHCGVIQAKDLFYGQHDPSSRAVSYELLDKWEAWQKMGCLASEMESAAIYILSSLLRCRAGAVFSVVANQEREAKNMDNPVVHDTSYASKIAVEAIRKLIVRDRIDTMREIIEDASPEIVICDFDGTIAFTEKPSFEAYRTTLECYGVNGFSKNDWHELVGHTDAEIWNELLERHADSSLVNCDAESLNSECRDVFLEKAKQMLVLNTWIESYLECRPNVVHKIVSNNSEKIISQVISILDNNLTNMFGEIVSCADIGKDKYEVWEALAHEIEPSKVLIIEDNPTAISHAIKKGYTVIAVQHEYNEHDLKEIDGIAVIVQ